MAKKQNRTAQKIIKKVAEQDNKDNGSFFARTYQYIIPFILYMGITPILGWFIEDPTYAGYIIKTIIVLGTLIYFRKKFTELKFNNYPLAIGAGVLIIVIWIGIDGLYPHIGEPGEFNPFLFTGGFAWSVIVFKILGMILIAPLVEELFTRSFLLRYIISEKFEDVPIGKYTLASFIITVAFFGLAHGRWLAGLITAVILNLLLYKTKSIGDCVVAHSVANAVLAGYVLYAQNWFLW